VAGISRRLALALALAITSAAALPFAGCGSNDDGAPSAADAGPEATVQPDAVPQEAAPQGCAADRSSDGMWQHLTCAGLYADFASKRVDPALRPYKPALELWSDGAQKQRWIFLPPGTKIDTSSMDEWVFPIGTRVWKEFKLDTKRVETRLYEKAPDGTWRHASFRWADDESDAVRTDDGVKIARGGADVPPYEIPSANQCNDCHGGRKDKLLGFEAVSLGLTGAEGLTLTTLVAEGLLSAAPSSTTLTFPEDATGSAAAALAWLHVSCGACHNRSSSANGEKSRVYTLAHATELLDQDGGATTVQTLDAYVSTVGHVTTVDIPDGGGATFSMIKAGDPGASLVSYLSGQRVSASGNPNEKVQMPPIVTRLVDTKGHALLDTWISALPP
jgi:hypothetical protein